MWILTWVYVWDLDADAVRHPNCVATNLCRFIHGMWSILDSANKQ
jgi:hypothetical protein